jgi:UDP-N-acetylglucosamine 2-epimerase (non-hydrolysing)
LNTIADRYGLRIIVSTHPRTRIRIEETHTKINPKVKLIKPFGFFDYVHLQTKARATLSDSGTISEESSILNFPALNIRNTHERPEAMEEGSVMLTGLEPQRVIQGLQILETQARGDVRNFRLVEDYSMPNVSDKVLRIIVSYTDYVKRYVWHEGGETCQ